MAKVVAVFGVAVFILSLPAPAQDCPELAGQWPNGPVWDVAISGDLVFFGDGSTLSVADVSNPAAPQFVGAVVLPGDIKDIEVAGDHAYVAADRSGLRIVDVSAPDSPTRWVRGNYHIASGIAVSGDYAFVAESTQGCG